MMMSVIEAVGTPRGAPPAVVSRLATRLGRFVVLAGMAGLVAGCSPDSILGSNNLPPDITDPAITKTPQGALAAYYGLRDRFRFAFGSDAQSSVTAVGGLLGDELQVGGSELGVNSLPVDARELPEGLDDAVAVGAYSSLQRVRGQASQAIGLLRRYAPEQRALLGHAYVLEAYSEVFLAELFCSGIPLSTLDFDGDYTLRPGSSTDEVYAHALALLDTALTLVGDSTRFVNLARMAQARAYLGLGQLAEAAAAAASVPDGYVYSVSFVGGNNSDAASFAYVEPSGQVPWRVSVSDREGANGLDYRSSGDPRASATLIYTNNYGWGIYHPDKYSVDGSTPIVLASGVEARLIEAEAKLAQGDAGWLAMLNALRTDGTYSTQPNAADPARTDTLWNAGTGGVAGLAPLEDPGTPDARLDLVFRERAFWLFLTGHRQADLRRLVRYYGRPSYQVYPTGAYPAPAESYGNDVTIPIPVEERTSNPLFTGCIARDA
jgi:hypothetical protein